MCFVCVCVRVYCSFVGHLCIQLLVFCIPLVVKRGGYIWLFPPQGLGFESSFLGLSYRLYFGAFYSKAISGSMKDMSVMFTTLAWKFLGLAGGALV